MVTAGSGLNTQFPGSNGSLCPRTQLYVSVSADVENGDGDGLDTELLNGNEGEYTHMEDDSEKLASMAVTSAIKISEVNQDSVDKLNQLEMAASDSLDTSGIASQVSSGQLGQKSISSPGHYGHTC